MEKPSILIREEFVSEITKLINETPLPLFVIEPILQNLLNEVHVTVKKQYEYEKEQYQKSLSGKDEGDSQRGD